MDINNKKILNIYKFGSRVYGTYNSNSDYDYIIVVEDDFYTTDHITENNKDYNIYSKTQWIKKCEKNDLKFCECFFLKSPHKIKETFIPNFKIDKEKIRCNFSKISSNSFVKCKKKLTVKKDFNPYIGKKSLWHSFRILMFGIQLLENENINNYECANFLYDEIVNEENNDWNYFKEKYQKIYNKYRSEFRKFDEVIND